LVIGSTLVAAHGDLPVTRTMEDKLPAAALDRVFVAGGLISVLP